MFHRIINHIKEFTINYIRAFQTKKLFWSCHFQKNKRSLKDIIKINSFYNENPFFFSRSTIKINSFYKSPNFSVRSINSDEENHWKSTESNLQKSRLKRKKKHIFITDQLWRGSDNQDQRWTDTVEKSTGEMESRIIHGEKRRLA